MWRHLLAGNTTEKTLTVVAISVLLGRIEMSVNLEEIRNDDVCDGSRRVARCRVPIGKNNGIRVVAVDETSGA